MSNYALIKAQGELYIIENAIVCDATFAAAMLIANGGDYDYAIDYESYDPQPAIGYSYDPELDVFTAPPVDYEQVLYDAIATLEANLANTLNAYWNANSGERSNAISRFHGDYSASPVNEIAVMDAAFSYFEGE